MEEWKIERRKPGCSACGKPFASGEDLTSAILESPDASFARREFCRGCWSPSRDGIFSYWETRIPPLEDRRLHNVPAMIDFFRKLVAAPLLDPTRRKVAFLAALLLARRRKVRLLPEEDGWIPLETAWNGDTLRIPDPEIAEKDLESLKEEMERLFQELSAAAEGVPPVPTVAG